MPETFDEPDPMPCERRVLRYTVDHEEGAKTFSLRGNPVHVGNGGLVGEIDFWVVDSDGVPKTTRRFQVFGTSEALPPDARHIGTCPRTAGEVWHLFEVD
jgi:hypothetical protein